MTTIYRGPAGHPGAHPKSPKNSAEREGFEPSDPVSQVNSLAVSPIRPLSHLSRYYDLHFLVSGSLATTSVLQSSFNPVHWSW